MIFAKRNLILLTSLLCLYSLPHFLGDVNVVVSAAFAVVLIGSSRLVFNRDHLVGYAVYIAMSIGTYYILFQDQPWEFLFGWLPEKARELLGEGLPVSICSVIMSIAGWLLLAYKADRNRYLWVTLLIQIPLSVICNVNAVQSILELIAKAMGYANRYASWAQVWQFLWMVNYYLPIYFWSHKKSY